MSQFSEMAAEAWTFVYKRTPPWRPAHFSALEDAERVCGSLDAAMDSWRVFLSIRDSKYFAGHSPIMFAKHLDQFAVIPVEMAGVKQEAGCNLCDGNGWRIVCKAKTPRGIIAAEAATPCRCPLGRKISSKLAEERAR